MLIINNPQNPTGGLIEKSEIDKLVKGFKEISECCNFSDEIYSRQIYDGKSMPSFFYYLNYSTINSMDGWSKHML